VFTVSGRRWPAVILVRLLAALAVVGVVVGVLGGLASLIGGGFGPESVAGALVVALVVASAAGAALVGARSREWLANAYW